VPDAECEPAPVAGAALEPGARFRCPRELRGPGDAEECAKFELLSQVCPPALFDAGGAPGRGEVGCRACPAAVRAPRVRPRALPRAPSDYPERAVIDEWYRGSFTAPARDEVVLTLSGCGNRLGPQVRVYFAEMTEVRWRVVPPPLPEGVRQLGDCRAVRRADGRDVLACVAGSLGVEGDDEHHVGLNAPLTKVRFLDFAARRARGGGEALSNVVHQCYETPYSRPAAPLVFYDSFEGLRPVTCGGRAGVAVDLRTAHWPGASEAFRSVCDCLGVDACEGMSPDEALACRRAAGACGARKAARERHCLQARALTFVLGDEGFVPTAASRGVLDYLGRAYRPFFEGRQGPAEE
jgi:hypothetical protein